MTRKRQQRLKFEEIIKINDWLKACKHKIESTEMTQIDAQKLATEELGFEVPRSSLQHLARIVGVKWAKSPPPPAPVPLDREAIIILISSLYGLYVETVGSVPKMLEDLKSTYVQNQPKSQNNEDDEDDKDTDSCDENEIPRQVSTQ